MATLADVNSTLIAQNEVLTKNTALLEKSVSTMMQQFKISQAAAGDRLEKEREKGKLAAAAGGLAAGARRAGGSIRSGIGGIGGLMNPAAMAAMASALGSRFITRGGPAALGFIFADQIADFLLDPTASDDLRKQVKQAVQLGFAGSIFGKRFAVLGAAAGFLIDDNVKTEFEKLAVDIANAFSFDVKNFSQLVPLLEDLGKWARTNITEGLEGIRSLITGDLGGLKGNILETLGLLGTLALVISPGRSIGAVAGLTGKTLGLAITGVTTLFRGLPAMLGGLGALATSVSGAAAASPNFDSKTGRMRDPQTGRFVQGAGQGKIPLTIARAGGGAARLGAIALGAMGGPIGIALSAGVLGAIALSEVVDSPAGQSFIDKYIRGKPRVLSEEDRQARIESQRLETQEDIDRVNQRIREKEAELQRVQKGEFSLVGERTLARQLENAKKEREELEKELSNLQIMQRDTGTVDPSILRSQRLSSNNTDTDDQSVLRSQRLSDGDTMEDLQSNMSDRSSQPIIIDGSRGGDINVGGSSVQPILSQTPTSRDLSDPYMLPAT